MFRRKQKKEIELLSIAKRNEAAKFAPKTSSELKAKRRAVRSMCFDHNPETFQQLQPLEEKRDRRKLSEPLLDDYRKTRTTYTPPPIQQASPRTDARLKLIEAGSAQDTKKKPTEVHTSTLMVKVLPNRRTTSSRAHYRHSTYVTTGGVPNEYLSLFMNSKSHEKLCEEEEDIQTLKFDDLGDVSPDPTQRDRTSTENSMFDVSYEL